MQHFIHDGIDLAFIDEGEGDPVLLIHGFASSISANWVNPGWVDTLNKAGYRAIAIDNRGHGKSEKIYDPEAYTPDAMAGDAAALLDHLKIRRAHVMGYSMGARIAAFMALLHPDHVASLILGGLGYGMVEGVGDWAPISRALLADDVTSIDTERGRMFRAFADQTQSDRKALAACISRSRDLLTEQDAARIEQPTLVAVGTSDDIAGSPERLAALMPDAEAFSIQRRDHMLSVGDRSFKQRALQFLEKHPL